MPLGARFFTDRSRAFLFFLNKVPGSKIQAEQQELPGIDLEPGTWNLEPGTSYHLILPTNLRQTPSLTLSEEDHHENGHSYNKTIQAG